MNKQNNMSAVYDDKMVVNEIEFNTIKSLCLESYGEFNLERAFAVIHSAWSYDLRKSGIVRDEPTIESVEDTLKQLLQGVFYDLCYVPISDEFQSNKIFGNLSVEGQRHIPRIIKRGTDNKSSFAIKIHVEIESRQIEMCEDEGLLKMIENGQSWN